MTCKKNECDKCCDKYSYESLSKQIEELKDERAEEEKEHEKNYPAFYRLLDQIRNARNSVEREVYLKDMERRKRDEDALDVPLKKMRSQLQDLELEESRKLIDDSYEKFKKSAGASSFLWMACLLSAAIHIVTLVLTVLLYKGWV